MDQFNNLQNLRTAMKKHALLTAVMAAGVADAYVVHTKIDAKTLSSRSTLTRLEESLRRNDRRSFMKSVSSLVLAIPAISELHIEGAAASEDEDLLLQIKEARGQLDQVPELIKQEQWDKIRAILIKPPISSCWTSRGKNKLLEDFADQLDDIEALELKEQVISHLRYLDMAAYNNVFNPIATEGTSGATKELVRSYYEDPTNELEASKSALDSLIKLVPEK